MLNELSLRKVNSKANAQSLMSEFVNAASHASVHGFSEIRLYEGAIQTFYQIPLWDDYNIDNWLRDNSVNDDVKDKFRVIIGTFPLFKEEEFIANEQFTRSEFAYNYAGKEEIIFGLGAAYIYNTLAISLISHDCWSNTGVPISHYFMKGDGTDDTVNVEAKNFFDIISFDFHLDWWNKLRVDNLAKSQELWDRRNEFFPHLEFSPEVEDQIKKLGFSKFLFQIIERLKSLNEFATNWTKGNFDVNGVNGSTNLNISSESDATLKKYGTLRKFTVPGNGKEIFDLHIKTGDLRFHFFADPKKNKIYIGYIGKHLRTVLYK